MGALLLAEPIARIMFLLPNDGPVNLELGQCRPCDLDDCTTIVPIEFLFCPDHWGMIPLAVQELVCATYEIGTPLHEQTTACHLSIEVAKKQILQSPYYMWWDSVGEAWCANSALAFAASWDIMGSELYKPGVQIFHLRRFRDGAPEIRLVYTNVPL